MASNFPGLKDPRKQSRLGRLADRDVELGHAREWSRERLAAARRAEDDAAKYKAATRRDIAGVAESTGLGRSPSDALRENLEKALVKPSLLGMTAPLALSVPTTTAGKVIGGGIGAALGGIGGEDPYFSALSMLHPTLAMAQMVNAAYRDEPMLPITDAQGAGFPRRLIDLPGPARTARRYTPDERVAMLNELAPYARPKKLDPKASNILTSVLDDSVKQNETTVLYDQFNKPISMYSMAGRGSPFDDSEYLSGLVSLNGPQGTGRQAAQHAARNSPLEGFRLFNTPTSKGFWDRIVETEPDWGLQYMPEHGLSAYRYLPPIKFAGGGSVAGAAKRLAQRAMSQAGDVDPVVAPRGALSVVKNKGGNWLTGSVEDSLKVLKQGHFEDSETPALHEALRKAGVEERFFNARDPETGMDMLVDHPLYDQTTLNFIANRPINTWIDKQLTRYVKNEMATPEDPIRALAERGVLHFDPNEVAQARRTVHPSGEVPRTMGESPLAKAWEQTSDNFIAPETAGRFKVTLGQDGTTTVSRNPWLEKLPNDAIVHDVYESSRPSQLGFDHLTDELANALNPESGLPRHLLLDPNSLPRVSVPQAVERVSAINAWRAAQKAEADAMRANNAATVLHKEYPEKGMKWVELKSKQDVPAEGYTITPVEANNGTYWKVEGPGFKYPSSANTEAEAIAMTHKPALADALKYEGDTMGHCVGGYCDDVASGRSRIYSLRDAKGQPHVTIETRPERKLAEADLPDDVRDMLAEEMGDASREEFEAAVAKAVAERQIPDRIVQIKGKQNRAPNPEYLPFVQDFVKSGKWSDVGDLHNTGLKRLGGEYYLPSEMDDLAKARGQWKFTDSPDWETLPEILERLRPEYTAKYADPAQYEKEMTAHLLSKTGKTLGGEEWLNTDYFRLKPVEKAAGGLSRIAARIGKDAAPARKGVGSVVKNKGGNWLTGSVEDSLNGLRRDVPFEGYRSEYVPTNYTDPASSRFKWKHSRTGQVLTDDEYARLQDSPPIDTWIDKQLTRYVKNEMATPEDPIRALAERGVLHVDSASLPAGNRQVHPSGEHLQKLALNPEALKWENAADYAILPRRAEIYQDFGSSNMSGRPGWDWIKKLSPETQIYAPGGAQVASDLGFPHLIDELSNAINPESGLPRHLQFPADRLNKVSVPQAVERVSAINQWRAAQKAEADALRANNAATQVYKEYPENNPLGLRWVELRAPTPPEGWVQEGAAWRHPDAWKKEVAKEHPWLYPNDMLQDALKYEGDMMGHCVGGYCDDVISGRTQIYSLRDAKGQPHVTVEVVPGNPTITLREAIIRAQQGGEQIPTDEDAMLALADRYLRDSAGPPRIVQIKGKGNAKPNDEYLPFVQDFVKSGQWSDVGDLQNAGLRKLPDNRYITNAQFDEAIHRLTGEGEPSVNAEWFNRQIRNDPKWWGNAKGAFEGFAQGGLVEAMIEQNLDALVEKQTPKQMSRGGSVRAPIRVKIEKMTSELRQCRN